MQPERNTKLYRSDCLLTLALALARRGEGKAINLAVVRLAALSLGADYSAQSRSEVLAQHGMVAAHRFGTIVGAARFEYGLR